VTSSHSSRSVRGSDRRTALRFGAVGLGALVVSGLSPQVFAQRKPAGPDTVPVEELMKQTGLPDLAIGKADAPVTIVEYASMTCGHCASFHTKVYGAIKEKYVDTGKVRFVFREFPLDDFAMAASMLGRCTGSPEKALAFTSVLFAKQEEWAFVRENKVGALFKFAKQAGFTQENFDKCLTDQKMLDEIAAGRERGSKVFGVSATPAFFINGKRFTGRSDQFEAFDAVIQPLLPKS
jgi:protein-disulfide isomerase